MKQWLRQHNHIWTALYAFIYLPWFFYLEDNVKTDYHIIHTEMDDMIPFEEIFIIPYLLWFIYVGGTLVFFFFRNQQEYYRLCCYLFTGMTISLIICTIFPNGTDLRPTVDPDKNFCSRLVSYLHMVDTSTNIFPSIHVYNSVVTHVAIIRSRLLRDHQLIHTASFLLAVSICLATVFLKQHSVVDLVGGLVMAYALYPVIYGKRQYMLRRRLLAWKGVG